MIIVSATISSTVVAVESMAAVSGYNRELESEADQVGLDLMTKANYDSTEALRLFEHLKQEIEAEGLEEPFFFGTHPNVRRRIENVRDWLAGNQIDKHTVVKSTAEFEARLQRVILANARRDAEVARGEGDAGAARIYADAFGRDAEFYGFLRSLEAYRQTLGEGTTLVLSPKSEFFRYLEGIEAGRRRASGAPARQASQADGGGP